MTEIPDGQGVIWVVWYTDYSEVYRSLNLPDPGPSAGAHLPEEAAGEQFYESHAAEWYVACGLDLPARLMGRVLETPPSGSAASLDGGESASKGSTPPPGGEPGAAGAAASGIEAVPRAAAQPKRTRRPREISKIQKAIALLRYRAEKGRQSIRIRDIASDPYVACSPQNLYKSPAFMKELKATRARSIRRGWKSEGVADSPDDSTFGGVES
jgi:hypothetical protein